MRAFVRRHWDWGLLLLLAIPALWPYAYGLPRSADGFLHILRTALLDHHLRQGVLYPRWVPELVIGYGYPIFNFYGPASYYLNELLHLLGLGPYQALMSTFVVMVLVGGCGMRLLAADVFGAPHHRWAPLVAATAYMYTPYLLTNVYIRAAIGEVGAQALLPWIFWSFRRLMREPQPAAWVLPAALSLGGLACTHNITLIFLPPVLLGYLALLWWQAKRAMRRLAWAAAGGLAAMGLSAFFWLPVMGERQYLADTAYKVAANLFIPENVWTWRNFLNTAFPFHYSEAIPFQLGLMQLVLGVAGWALAQRWDAEWIFLLITAVLACLGISRAALPLWFSSDILLVAQFPWRLLAIAGLPLALFAGGSLIRLQPGRWQAAGAVALLGVIILANRPGFPLTQYLITDNTDVSLPAVAQFETETSGMGTSSTGEFMPRWAQSVSLDPATVAPPNDSDLDIRLEAASAYELDAVVSSPTNTSLRLTNFYYPGWRATLEDGRTATTYPTTNVGLLTIDLPAGTHRLQVRWQGTTLEQRATLITLATLALLSVGLWLQRRRRWLCVVSFLLFAFGAWAMVRPLPVMAKVQAPPRLLASGGMRLLGYQVEQVPPLYLYLYPYWYVPSRPARLRAHWRLTDAQGRLVTESLSEPFFNAVHSDDWPASTLADDSYRLALPPGLAAGTYRLWLQLQPVSPGADAEPPPALVGEVALEAVPPQRQPTRPTHQTDYRFGGQILLAGFDVSLNGKRLPETGNSPVVQPGDLLEYTLYWRALGPIVENYHGFIHLLDVGQGSLVQQDQIPGAWFRTSSMWDTFQLQPDVYRLQIPATAESGLYWPRVGLYHFKPLDQLAVEDASGQHVGDSINLPPVKVLRARRPTPHYIASARFEEVATLLGYDLALPPGGLRGGSTLTVTLYYRSEQATPVDYTEFVHLYNPEQGLAAQYDAPPQRGGNPTSAWVPGEIIADQAVLHLGPDIRPGVFSLRVGLYDPQAGGARLPVRDARGDPLPDDQVILAELRVEP